MFILKQLFNGRTTNKRRENRISAYKAAWSVDVRGWNKIFSLSPLIGFKLTQFIWERFFNVVEKKQWKVLLFEKIRLFWAVSSSVKRQIKINFELKLLQLIYGTLMVFFYRRAEWKSRECLVKFEACTAIILLRTRMHFYKRQFDVNVCTVNTVAYQFQLNPFIFKSHLKHKQWDD